MKRTITKYLLVGAILGSLLSGCAKWTEPFRDAPRANVNDDPADTVTFPDGFNNLATKCDHGNRVYVTYHSDAPYGAVAVVPNAEDC